MLGASLVEGGFLTVMLIIESRWSGPISYSVPIYEAADEINKTEYYKICKYLTA